ncbi:hypothetical protein [Streptomyces lavendulae]|uniref:hypothetical protein n=1 Tax=Streptomyces lavendulae TaxID=1914 RepID=UPI0024A1E0E9|nr:hypothetical protein Sros01_43790 [Streptomyces roseochromogenus]
MNARKRDPRPELLPDQGAAVDEHGRPPGVPSRTGTGDGPPVDPDRVERAHREERDRKAAGARSTDPAEAARGPAE